MNFYTKHLRNIKKIFKGMLRQIFVFVFFVVSSVLPVIVLVLAQHDNKNKNNIQRLFNIFDTNGDGVFSTLEMNNHFGNGKASFDALKTMMKALDKNHDSIFNVLRLLFPTSYYFFNHSILSFLNI